MQTSKINPLWDIALSVFSYAKIGEGIVYIMLFKVYLRKINTSMHHKPFVENWELEISPNEGGYILYDEDSRFPSHKIHKVIPTRSSKYAGVLLVEEVCPNEITDSICSPERDFTAEIKSIPAFSGFSNFSKW